ncbi:MAG: hypothetical protein LBV72_02270 [Tannerella sp.]|jgi:hypothetical protein|nr:hypothetical protein [Tannerella sp.]
MNTKGVKFLKIFLPVLFMMYLGAIISFTHVHIENGVTIVHAHPYKDKSEHHHSGAELQLLHQISTILLTGTIAFAFIFKIARLIISTFTIPSTYSICQSSSKGTFQLRAPPISACIF